jgi:hypothetical protein
MSPFLYVVALLLGKPDESKRSTPPDLCYDFEWLSGIMPRVVTNTIVGSEMCILVRSLGDPHDAGQSIR